MVAKAVVKSPQEHIASIYKITDSWTEKERNCHCGRIEFMQHFSIRKIGIYNGNK